MSEQQQPQGGEQQQAAGHAQQGAPPWGEDFDPKRAWDTIQNLRRREKELEARPVLTDEQKQQLAEYDRIQQAAKSDLDKANEQVTRWQTDAEKWRGEAVAATVRALAAPDFADPDDAVRNIDPKAYLGADGAIDEGRIKADLGKLLNSKPHYRRSEGTPGPRPPGPNSAQGTSAASTGSATDPKVEFASILQSALK